MGVITSCHKKSTVIPMMTTLTPEQIALIQKTWAIPSQNAIDSGEAILLAFFEKYPKNQDKFSSFKNTPLLSLKVCLLFCCSFFRIYFVFSSGENKTVSCTLYMHIQT